MSLEGNIERKSIHELAFDHYLRNGERLTNEEWLARQEYKFNPYHDELGRFTSALGATVSYGDRGRQMADRPSAVGRSTTGQTTTSRSKEGQFGTRPLARSGNKQPRDRTVISTLVGTVAPDRMARSGLLDLAEGPHTDISAGDTAVSFGLRQIGTGNYQQFDANPHAVGRISDFVLGRGTPRCNAFVYDALNWAGAAPSRMGGGRIPVALEWGNPVEKIGYYPVVAAFTVPRTGVNSAIIRQLKEGDVISDGTHVGLVTLRSGLPRTISAVTAGVPGPNRNSDLPVLGGVVRNDWGFRAGQKVVVRRFDAQSRMR